MDVFVIEQVIDLGGVNMPMIYRQALTQHDAYAHEWRVSIRRHGHAVDLTGCTAQIYFGPVNRTGDGIEPGRALTQGAKMCAGYAYAQLLPELYRIDGRVMAIMQISDPQDHVMTAAVLHLHTRGVLEGDIGDPSGSVIELGALLAQLSELRTQTAAAREATAQSMAQQEAAAQAEEQRAAAEDARSIAEAARVEGERQREDAEGQRAAAEDARAIAEAARAEGERQREEAEGQRAHAEGARAIAEADRAEDERQREESEEQRVHAEGARAIAEDARAESERLREEAEGQRAQAEGARAIAETARAESERQREDAEGQRAAAEGARAIAETARAESERQREEAEEQRAAAEDARAIAETARAEGERRRTEAEEQRAAAEQARDAAEQARQETFAGYEERLVAATPDDTTVDGRAWTSKKTVDALCLPIEASGNPVQIDGIVEGYPLGVKVSWEPVQEGEGDPSPDNIRPITGRDAASVTRSGKNLIDVKPIEGEKWGNNYNDMVNALNKLPVGVYTLSFDITLTSFNDRYTSDTEGAIAFRSRMDVNGAPVTIYNGITIYRNAELPINRHFEYTLNIGETQKGNFEAFYLYSVGRDTYAEGAPNGALGYARFYNYQIVLGSTATAYEPYTGSTTDIALPETVYGGTLDLETGVVASKWAQITLDRRKLIRVTNTSKNKSFYEMIEMYAFYPMPADNQEYLTTNTSCNVARIVEPYGGGEESEYLVYVLSDGRIRTSVALYESDAEIRICYPMKNLRAIELAPQQIAALSDVNTLYTDAGALTVTGREDPRHTIVTLTDRIAALESAAAGV